MTFKISQAAAAATLVLVLGACSAEATKPSQAAGLVALKATPLDQLISHYAAEYKVPEPLVRSVIKRESGFNPKARNGPYIGLMQIHPQTARTMGYRGPAKGLYDADTNLKYAVKYLAGAYLVADGNFKRADWLYQTGYYYVAKRKGLLVATGLRPAKKK